MDELHKILSQHRFFQAKNSLNSAKILIQHQDFEGAATSFTMRLFMPYVVF